MMREKLIKTLANGPINGHHKNIPLALELADRVCMTPYDCPSRTAGACDSAWQVSDELAIAANERFTPTPAGGEPILFLCSCPVCFGMTEYIPYLLG